MPSPAFSRRPSAADRRLLTTPPQLPRPSGLTRTISPAVAAAHRDGGDALWARAVHGGAPLIDEPPDDADEPHASNAATASATRMFTWVHRGEARHVALVAGKITDASTLEEALFERVPDTDMWTLTLLLPADWRTTYAIAIDDGSPAQPAPHLAERRRRALAAADPSLHGRIDAWYSLLAATRPDPLARDEFRGASVAAGPDAPLAPELRTPAHPGTFAEVTVPSASGGTRSATWYVPPTRHDAGSGGANVIVMLDGDRRLKDGGTAFDTWAQSYLAPGTVALLLGHGGIATRDADLTCSPELVADLRALLAEPPVPITADPACRAIQGSSLGGLSALYAQCTAPDLFAVSICQSPSFWWPNELSGHTAEWLTNEIARSDIRFGRVHLSVGTDEWVLTGPVRRMRDALVGRCATLDYEEFAGGHEAACWEAALPAVLTRLGIGA